MSESDGRGRERPTAYIHLQGTNGYRATIFGSSKSLYLTISRRHEAAVYRTFNARVTNSALRAKFGRRGKISVWFVPSSDQPDEGCDGGGQTRAGIFEGRIRFHGEQGFTEIDVARASGALSRTSDRSCRSRSAQRWSAAREAAAGARRLGIEAVGLQDGIVTFRAGRNAFKRIEWLPIDLSDFPAVGVPYSAITLENGEGMQIYRGVAAKGPLSGVIRDGEAMTTTVTPPRPFSGSGTLLKCRLQRRWQGWLRVDLPGRSDERLAGRDFNVRAPYPADCISRRTRQLIAYSMSAREGARERASCERPNSETLASNSQARVFSVGPEGEERVVGCFRRTNRRYALAVPRSKSSWLVVRSGIDNVELVGIRVAYSWFTEELDTGLGGVVVRNLANGRVTRRRPILTVRAPFSRVTQLELNAAGSVAWIGEASEAGERYLRQVIADDRAGFRLLDESREIDPTSLTLDGGELTWLNAGSRRTAPFR